MASSAPAAIRLKLEFTRAADNIAVTEYFVLDAALFRRLQLWQVQQNGAANAETISGWLRRNNGQRDRKDGPAFIKTGTNGYRYEAWWSKDQFDRKDGPAIIETRPDGSRREEWWRKNQRHREGGPAVIQTSPDGYRHEEWYSKGQFLKEETLPSLASIPGVTILTPAP